jgi:hypothetical protein
MYNPATDFSALWRNIAGVVSKVEMPTLDLVVAALARAGLFTLVSSATAPVANQATTAWLDTQTPSWAGEGTLNLWNPVTTAYVPATAALFLDLLQASAGQNGVSWRTSTGGPPLNTVGNNGDFAVRLDEPNGIYGPKAAGAWPANPIPGTADVITSTALDNTFGVTAGALITRGVAAWQALELGAANTVLASIGGLPVWEGLSALFDIVFGAVEGALLVRGASTWGEVPPNTAGFILTDGGPGALPSYQVPAQTFPSGTIMIFQQSAAPTGWTKQTTLNDCGLRVTSGTTGFTSGSAFSTVFAQTAVGNTTLSSSQIPSHTHNYLAARSGGASLAGGVPPSVALNNDVLGTTDGGTGGNGAHTHSVNLTLAYADVIIASKD